MEAGRELDALVAEKVMGMKLRNLTDTSCELFHGDKWHACGPCSAYSTSIAAAWEVVERFRRGCNGKVAACVDVCVTDIPDSCDTYCKIYGPDTAEAIEWAETAPLAICLAALKAVGK